jgi:hypothetical protein
MAGVSIRNRKYLLFRVAPVLQGVPPSRTPRNEISDMPTRAPDTDPATGAFAYRFRPRMIGADIELSLAPGGRWWRSGSREIEIPLFKITRVRLGLRPSGIIGRRYLAELWSSDGRKVGISSASRRVLIDVHDNGPAYRAFILELHRRIAAARADCEFVAGFPAWRWWPAVAVGAVIFLGCGYVVIGALFSGHYGIGLALAGFGAIFVWQSGKIIFGNRPRRYAPDAIPVEVLPKG